MIKLKCDNPGLGLLASVGLRELGAAEGPFNMLCNSPTNVLTTKLPIKARVYCVTVLPGRLHHIYALFDFWSTSMESSNIPCQFSMRKVAVTTLTKIIGKMMCLLCDYFHIKMMSTIHVITFHQGCQQIDFCSLPSARWK